MLSIDKIKIQMFAVHALCWCFSSNNKQNNQGNRRNGSSEQIRIDFSGNERNVDHKKELRKKFLNYKVILQL